MRKLFFLFVLFIFIAKADNNDPTFTFKSLNFLNDWFGGGQYTTLLIGPDGFPVITFFDGQRCFLKTVFCEDIECNNYTTVPIDKGTGSCLKGLQAGRYPVSVIGKDKNLFIAYYENNFLVANHCKNSRCTEMSKRVIDPDVSESGEAAMYADLTFSDDNLPLISYWDQHHERLRYAKCLDVACEHSILKTIDDRPDKTNTVSGVGKYNTINYSPQLKAPVFSYYTALPNTEYTYNNTKYNVEHGNLTYAYCSNITCNNPVIMNLHGGNSRDIGRYESAVIGMDGNPLIMYTDENTGTVNTFYCDNIYCNGTNIVSSIDHIGYGCYGVFPTMIINPDNGFGIMSYIDQSNHTESKLKIAQCLNIECTQYFIQTVASGQCGFGRDSSLIFSDILTDNSGNQYRNLYVSFLDFKGNFERKLGLAILTTSEPSLNNNVNINKNIINQRNEVDFCMEQQSNPQEFDYFYHN